MNSPKPSHLTDNSISYYRNNVANSGKATIPIRLKNSNSKTCWRRYCLRGKKKSFRGVLFIIKGRRIILIGSKRRWEVRGAPWGIQGRWEDLRKVPVIIGKIIATMSSNSILLRRLPEDMERHLRTICSVGRSPLAIPGSLLLSL